MRLLYLSMVGESLSHQGKLAGIRRYCASRGWEAVPVFREDVSPKTLPAILRRHRPIGCVVDGVGRPFDLPPRLFGKVPVSYIGYRPGKTAQFPNFIFDPAAIAEMALRELSAGMPPCYAVIGHPTPFPWSLRRTRAFRDAARASGAKCLVAPAGRCAADESPDAFTARLAPWLSKLPEHCAVFAVDDYTASLVVRAARAARRHIPKSLTLVSVDNFTDVCENADPPISSIQLDFEREGFLAAKALDERMKGRPAGEMKGNSSGGSAATLHCGEAATSLRTESATSLPPQAATSLLSPPRGESILGPLCVVRRKSTSGRGRHEPRILAAVEIIRREACDGLTAAALIARMRCSRSLFEMRFREAMGHSVLDEILHVRLERAFTLLAQTDMPIGAIPAFCGFRSYAALDFLFRTRFRMSMREWRKRNGHA